MTTYPGRVRSIVSNDGTVDEHGLLWGFRCKNYNAGTTAQLFYEAEQLLPVNGAAGTALAGASGGTAVVLTNPPASTWVSMLSMSMARRHDRAHAHRLISRVGALLLRHQPPRSSSCNTASDRCRSRRPTIRSQLPGAGAFYLLDLGEARLDAPPVGPMQWFGAIQANTSVASQNAAIDCVYLQPLDEGAGKLTYTPTSPSSSIMTSPTGGTAGADDASVGSIAWTNPGNITAQDGVYAVAVGPAGAATSHYLKVTGFGFALPSGATIQGIQVNIVRLAKGNTTKDSAVRLVKAGSIQTTDRSNGAFWPYLPAAFTSQTYGGPTDLWGGSWVYSDINSSTFGVALSASIGAGLQEARVDFVSITVYYTLASGFTIAPDAVMAAGKLAELRTEGMFRQGAGGTIYAPVSQVVGDLPRIPPSHVGLEARTVQMFLKPSRGEFDNEPDSGIDDISAHHRLSPFVLVRWDGVMSARDAERIAATTSDLIGHGYRPAGPNLWLHPEGMHYLTETTAIAEVTALMAAKQEKEQPQ